MKTRKSTAIVFIAMLLLQTVFTNVGLTNQAYADDSGSSVVLSDGHFVDEGTDGSEATRTVEFQWTLNEQVEIDKAYEGKVPENSRITEEQSGELTHEDGKPVGTYEATIDGGVFVTFDVGIEGLAEAATGTFTVEVAVEASGDQASVDTNGDSTSGEPGEGEPADDTEKVVKEEPNEDVATQAGGKVTEAENVISPAAEIKENIIDGIRLIREDGSTYVEGDLLEFEEDLRLELDWSLPNDPMYVSGDTFEFQLPEQLAIYSELTGDLGEYGSYVVDLDGHVIFTFNDMIDNNSNVKGTFWVDTELNKETIKTTTEELEFIMNDDVIERFTINVKPESGQAIQKNGQPVDGNFNSEEIEWTVIVNTTRDSLENAIVHDPIKDGQELVLDSIDLKEVEVNLQGHVIESSEKDATYEKNNSTLEKLELELGDTNKAYQLTFRTKMKEEEKDKEGSTSYSNTAYLKSDGKDEAQSGASVSVQRPESLVKTSSAFDKGDRSVEWEVKANFTEKQLTAGTEIVDEFTFTIGEDERNDVFEISLDDIEILQVDSFGDNGAVGETSDAKELFDIIIEGNKVTYKLNKDSNKAFVIKYKTTAKEGAYINDDGTISNTVGIDGKTSESSQGVGQQVGVKTNSGINYENQTIDWTIIVNADSQELRNFVLTDNFSGTGQKLVGGSIEIDPDATDAEVNLNPEGIAEGEGFEIDFGTITESYTITYTTDFTYDFGGTDEKPSFRNGVEVSYTTTDGKDYDLDFGDNINPNQETRSNGAKNSSVDNETKEITWMIDINYNQLVLDDAKLIDVIENNQSLVEGSVKIYPTTIAQGGKITAGEDEVTNFDVNIDTNEEGNEQINIDFGLIEQSYRVVFVTVDKDGVYNSDEVYENTAQFIPREGEVHNLKASATLPNQGEFLGKNGLHNRDDWTIDWELTVNESKSKLTDVTVKDDLGDGTLQILLEDSIEVTKVGSDEDLVAGEDYIVVVDGNEFSVEFPGEITDTYSVTYSSYILAAESAGISNEAVVESVDEVIVGNVESEETVEVRISTGGGTAEGVTGELILEKVETDTNRPLDNVAFTLSIEIGNQTIVVREGTTDADGKIHWTGLKFGDYTLEEVIPEGYLGDESQVITLSHEAPEGIQTITIDNERQTGTVAIEKADATTGEKLDGAVFEITNLVTGQAYTLTTEDDGTVSEEVPFGEYTVEEIAAPNGYRITEEIENITIEIDETTTIEVANVAFVDVAGQKTWFTDEDVDQLDPITVVLLANDEEVDDTQVSAGTNWEYSFTNLDKYDENGKEIEYSIEEVEVDGYISQKDGFDLTNIQTVTISGEKNWIEVDDQYRPDSITVNLLADDEEVNTQVVEVNGEGEWNFTFEGLPKYDTEGNEIEYTIEEESVTGYTSEVEDFTITNTQETTELSGVKTWLDDNSENRPETIKVQVKNGDTVVQETDVEADEEGEWTYTFTDLPKYDKEGNEITYTVDEEAVDGYEKSIDGNDITNLRVGETEVEVTKLWNDEDENDRPETITINLLQNDVHYDEHEVTAANNWERTITGLPQYDEEGVEYEYTITEHDVAGYATDVDGFNVTNTRADVKTIEVNKAWLDTDSEDRPDSIQVELFRSVTDGDKELVDTFTVESDNNWSLEITDLPAFDNDGKAYTYVIEEVAVEGYGTTINGFDITNLRVGKTEVSGEKTWVEVDDRYRPDTITVTLLANDEFEAELEISVEDDWTYMFEDLEKYDLDGKEIDYTVVEDDVPGYVSVVDGTNITNTQESTSVSGEKTWVEVDDRYRPDIITVTLLANGEFESELEISAEDNWMYTFEDLAKYDTDGSEIDYTVVEDDVPGYVSVVDGTNITNTQESTSVSGEKTWIEVDDRYRPDIITVTLLANDEEEATLEISAEDDWTYTFEDLAKYDKEGKEIVYTVVEDEVPGYVSEVDGTNITNTQESTSVSGEKTWVEVDEQYRPDSITVTLLANGEFEENLEVTANDEGEWLFTFENLAKYDTAGEEIEYTVVEVEVPGYVSEVDGFAITNTQQSTEISGTKTWKDDNATDRPASITVQVMNGDEVVQEQEVTATDDWAFTFTELAKFDSEGNEIEYTINELPVPGYATDIDGFDITNTRAETLDVAGTKTWKDDVATDRPDSITVQLLANGKVVNSLEVTAATDWTYIFEGLAGYDADGVAIAYSVDEVEVDGYETSINGYDITNTLIPVEEDTSVTPGDPKDPKDKEDKEQTLPKTATNIFNLMMAGILLVGIGLTVLYMQRRRANQSNEG